MVKSTKIQNKQNTKTNNKFGDSCVEKYEILDQSKTNERKFKVHSTSGKNYIVTVSRLVHCTCPDCEMRVRRCKHIDFIMNHVLHEKYPRIFYNDNALEFLFKNIPTSSGQ
jgi:predicted RNA-binding Zn-ribbon protein involved in translation (DUF1610 family)